MTLTGGKGDGKGKDKGGEGRDERGNVTGHKEILKNNDKLDGGFKYVYSLPAAEIIQFDYTPGSTNIAGWKFHHLKMYLLYQKWWFSIAMLVYRREIFLRWVETATTNQPDFLLPFCFFKTNWFRCFEAPANKPGGVRNT